MKEQANEATHRIVVGVDFERDGDIALREAIALAKRIEGSELHPVHALPRPDALTRRFEPALLSHMLSEGAAELRDRALAVARYVEGEPWSQRVVVHVRFGRPAEVLHQVAVDVDADMLVVGTHARTGLQRLILGSVAEEVLRTARLPVIVARDKDFAGATTSEEPDSEQSGEDLHGARSFSRSELLDFGQCEPPCERLT